jgi:hypothetical protein
MSTGWENHEPAPMEFFHGRLMDLFHEWREYEAPNQIKVLMDGSDFNRIVVKAKNETYAKYPKQNLQEAIPRSEM